MKLAHLILAHTNVAQLARLIARLVCDKADIYIHLDAKRSLSQFIELASMPNVFFIKKRTVVTWCAYSMVQATLRSLKEIVASKKNYSHINLLSGQDYPLKKAEEITDFYIANEGKSFMKFFNIQEGWKQAQPRLDRYDLSNFNFPFKYKAEYLINKILPKKLLPDNMIPYGMSQWLTLTPEHAIYVIEYLENNKKLERFFYLTWGADEMIFQTILLNSKYADSVINNYYRYIKFVKGASRPLILTLKDADDMLNSGKYYARKFDVQIDSKVLDYLDNAIDTA